MEVKFLSGVAIERAIKALLAEHDEAHWAVAWGTCTPLAKALLAQPEKLKSITFGLAFSQTDPDLVDALVGRDGCFVVKTFPGGTYHPKVYAFRSGTRAAAVIGSANFTRGGLGKNHEASVLITGSTSDPALADALAFAAESAKLGSIVSTELAQRYRLSCKIAARKPGPSRDPFKDLPRENPNGLLSPLIEMSWAEYVRAVHSSAHHDVNRSLNLLQTAQGWLSAVGSFQDLKPEQRKAIAGFLGARGKALGPEFDQDWGLFGSMRGAGDFMNRIAENDSSLASAVDSIPQKGEITRAHFDRFRDLFVKAFDNSERIGGVATASRLLAMKRPDVFLCISKPNRTAAAAQMGFADRDRKLKDYWDEVVGVVQASDWYNSDKPEGPEGRLWEARAAMLDSIFYRPK
ncbi:MAG: phospholipase D family protein [Caulobacter sp.]|nr:phospholipase D family protein [Caulobacter sp.]